jgi:DNA repair protein RadC
VKQYRHLPIPPNRYIRDPRDVLRLVRKFYARKRIEIVLILVVNRRKRVLTLVELSRGNSRESLFPINEILQIVLSVNGYGFIDIHNHLKIKKLHPSEADMDTFVDTQESARTLGIKHLDSLIISRSGRWFSMATNRPFKCPHCGKISIICQQCQRYRREKPKFGWLPQRNR